MKEINWESVEETGKKTRRKVAFVFWAIVASFYALIVLLAYMFPDAGCR